jgi:8-oxo-dGTP diphosphatase
MWTILLVRHGEAGDRHAWKGDDAKRPLDDLGRRQAERLVDLLEGRKLSRICSSPSLRCTQTVEPLAVARRLPVEHTPRLAEGASKADVLALLGELGKGEAPLLCTHGDVVEALLGRESEKGSTWVLELSGGDISPKECLAAAG